MRPPQVPYFYEGSVQGGWRFPRDRDKKFSNLTIPQTTNLSDPFAGDVTVMIDDNSLEFASSQHHIGNGYGNNTSRTVNRSKSKSK